MVLRLRRAAPLAAVPAMMMLASMAFAAPVTLPQGTQVPLVFDEGLSSRTAKAGDRVALHVSSPVKVGTQTVIAEGAKVMATVTRVDKRKRFGVNARMRLALDPVKAVGGQSVALEMRDKGKVAGSRTGEAAGASLGGAAVLGPVGLVGGYFIVGKPVIVKPGDPLITEVARDVKVMARR